jgi:hypothetical protein
MNELELYLFEILKEMNKEQTEVKSLANFNWIN